MSTVASVSWRLRPEGRTASIGRYTLSIARQDSGRYRYLVYQRGLPHTVMGECGTLTEAKAAAITAGEREEANAKRIDAEAAAKRAAEYEAEQKRKAAREAKADQRERLADRVRKLLPDLLDGGEVTPDELLKLIEEAHDRNAKTAMVDQYWAAMNYQGRLAQTVADFRKAYEDVD